jgi:hypothetical protein
MYDMLKLLLLSYLPSSFVGLLAEFPAWFWISLGTFVWVVLLSFFFWRGRSHPKVKIRRAGEGRHVFLDVTNIGASGDFFAEVSVSPKGAIRVPEGKLMARWDLGGGRPGRIVTGDRGRIRLARLHGTPLVGRWILLHNINGEDGETPFADNFTEDYPGSPDTVCVKVYSDPTLVGGPRMEKIRFHGGNVRGGGSPAYLTARQFPRSSTDDPKPPRPSPGFGP